MNPLRRARDQSLLDALDACGREMFAGTAWRIVREGRDPLQGSPAGGPWDPGTFDVLYTALERAGALAEIYFHLSRQPVFPSKTRWMLHRIAVRTHKSLRLADLSVLEQLGVERTRYADLIYAHTQEIGDAAAFLGFDGLIVPSARWPCMNLVLFTDRLNAADLVAEETELVDWAALRQAQKDY